MSVVATPPPELPTQAPEIALEPTDLQEFEVFPSGKQVFSSVEIFEPEFSYPQLQNIELTYPQVPESLETETNLTQERKRTLPPIPVPGKPTNPEIDAQSLAWSQKPSYYPTEPTPVSGAQLYQQRLAALKAGKLYTRLSPSSFHSSWSRASQQPTYQQWQQLLAREAQAASQGQGNNSLNILVGDSLSLWFPSQLLPKGELWLNQSISGENSGQILKRLPSFAKVKANRIYVLAGINDLRQGKSDQTILENIWLMMRNLKQNHPQAQIIIQSILPTRLDAIPASRIMRLNQQIQFLAQQEGVNYLNLHDFFLDAQGKLRQDFTTDGLHLSYQGYLVWQNILAKM